MIDREKVIKGLEICSEFGAWHGRDCHINKTYKDCPYRDCETGCVTTIAKDALALLKEQEEAMKIKDGTISNLIEQIRIIGEKLPKKQEEPEKPTLVWPVAPKR